MIVNRALITSFVTAGLLAQQSIPTTPKTPTTPPPNLVDTIDAPIERTSVSFVQVPTTVFDKLGQIVNGLQPNQFRLFDNGKEQDIHVDVEFQPISVVIVVDKSERTEAVLPQIRKSGNLIAPLVIGGQGEAAVLAFDHRILELQPFTSDQDKITDAFKKINAGSSSARMIDAVDKAVFMLRGRPATRRRIIMLISETRDQSSEGKFREALIDAQLSNVTIYSLNISRLVTATTTKPAPPRPDPLPPAAYNLPGGQPNTPTTVSNYTRLGNRLEFGPMLKEIYKDVKGLFVDNPSTIFTDQTGGEQYAFYRERGLQDVIQKMAAEIHSQYILSYNPNNKTEGGFHEIEIRVDRPEYKARARPGYFLASISK